MGADPDTIGRYRVIRSLGEGGMGSVYLADDPEIGRQVAIKLIFQARGSDLGQLRERFRREARAVGSLRHPNIITLYEFGSHQGEPFIAMEYIEGRTLASLIRAGTPIPLVRKLAIIEHVSAGLDHAHRQGIVHRDIKPANVMVGRDGAVKVLDFGIARGAATGTLTATGGVVGTLNYMSPEQLEGRDIDARTDVFSLGAVLYEFLAGQPAFGGDIQDGLLGRILGGHAEPILKVCPDLPPPVAAIVSRMLERDADRRFGTMEDVGLALAETRAALGDTSALDAAGRRQGPAPTDHGPEAETELLREWFSDADLKNAPAPHLTPEATPTVRPRRIRTALVGAAAFAVAAVTWAAWSYFGRGTQPPAPPVAPSTVAVEILPWATIESVVSKGDGKNVAPAGFVTPDLLTLLPGEYHLKAANPNFAPLEIDFTVPLGQGYVEVRRQMTGLDPAVDAAAGVRRAATPGGGGS